jgi:hypothetical protein
LALGTLSCGPGMREIRLISPWVNERPANHSVLNQTQATMSWTKMIPDDESLNTRIHCRLNVTGRRNCGRRGQGRLELGFQLLLASCAAFDLGDTLLEMFILLLSRTSPSPAVIAGVIDHRLPGSTGSFVLCLIKGTEANICRLLNLSNGPFHFRDLRLTSFESRDFACVEKSVEGFFSAHSSTLRFMACSQVRIFSCILWTGDN